MDFTGQLILAYLEEDDTRRVLFRVRPLITREGGINPEDLEELAQDGFLRIAPDRQEQHSFKERMSSLGELCLINLTHPETAMGKVRANKNYAPGRGENNRYIIYSDAIQALPHGMVYEVVSEERQHTSLTRQYYLRSGGRISGPHCPDGSIACPDSQNLMPDCERLFYVEMPDGTSRMFYWPLVREEQQGEAAAEAAPQRVPEEALPEQPAAALAIRRGSDQMETAAEHVQEALQAAGFLMDLQKARHLLLLCLLFDRVQIQAENQADAGLAAGRLAGLFPEGAVQLQEADGAALTLLAGSGRPGKKTRKRYLKAPWPVCELAGGDGFPALAQPPAAELNLKALRAEVRACEADEETAEALQHLLAQTEGTERRLPLYVRGQMARFACGAAAFGSPQEGLAAFLREAFVRPYDRALGILDADSQDGDPWL